MNRRSFVRSMVAGAGAALGGLCGRAGAASAEAAGRVLSEHRIVKMEVHRSMDRYPRFVGRGSSGKATGRGFGRQIRILVTDRGARGGAMSWAPDEEVRRFLGARVADLFDLERGTSEEATHLDQPLHDLVGQILGEPAYALMGAKGPKAVPIYSGAIHMEDLESAHKVRGVPAVVAACQQDYETGYRAFKLKIGRGLKWMPREDGIRRDIEVTRAVRERFADCQLLVDANNGYTPDDFLRYVSAVADCDLYMIEEPFQETRGDLLKLRDHMAKVGCKALIMEGESGGGPAEKTPWRWGAYSRRHIDNLFALAREKLVHAINLDLTGVGLSNWRRGMPELVEAGLQASPHTWAGTPRPYYTAHLAAGVGNVAIVEGIPGTATGMDYSAYTFKDGKLVVPDAPGFGLKLSF